MQFEFVCAVCLDGSLPGYHFQKGFGSGSNNWLLHIEVHSLIFLSFFVKLFNSQREGTKKHHMGHDIDNATRQDIVFKCNLNC